MVAVSESDFNQPTVIDLVFFSVVLRTSFTIDVGAGFGDVFPQIDFPLLVLGSAQSQLLLEEADVCYSLGSKWICDQH